MNIDITPEELKTIVELLQPDNEEHQKLLIKLTRYAFPEVDEEKLVEKYQEWKR